MVKMLLAIIMLPLFSCAQISKDSIQRQSNLFDRFVSGSVFLKSGEISEALLNYNTIDQSVLFEKEGKTLTLTGLLLIDSILINKKKFVPLNNKIYEVVNTRGKLELYLSYSAKLRPWVATADHNGSSKQNNNQVSNTVSDVYLSRAYEKEYSVEIIKHYWLKDYKNLHRANSLKDFLKVFKESAHPSISGYVKENPINFDKEQDIVRLVNFYNTL